MSVIIFGVVISLICVIYMMPERVVAHATTRRGGSTRIPRSLRRARVILVEKDPAKSRFRTRMALVNKLLRALETDTSLLSFVTDTFSRLLDSENSRHIKLQAIEGLKKYRSGVPTVQRKIMVTLRREGEFLSKCAEVGDNRVEELFDAEIIADDEEGFFEESPMVLAESFAIIPSDPDEGEEEEITEAA